MKIKFGHKMMYSVITALLVVLTISQAIYSSNSQIISNSSETPKNEQEFIFNLTPNDNIKAISYTNKAYLDSQKRIEEEKALAEQKRIEEENARMATEQAQRSRGVSTGSNFRSDGVWYDENYRYTWYSSNDLYHYRTSEWTAGDDNIYRDSDGYVVVASSDYPEGTVIENTPFGTVKVYDSGCASGTLDVYTNY